MSCRGKPDDRKILERHKLSERGRDQSSDCHGTYSRQRNVSGDHYNEFQSTATFQRTQTQIILSSNKEMMQPHFSKKVIVLLAVQRNLEESILTLSDAFDIFNNYPVGSVLYVT